MMLHVYDRLSFTNNVTWWRAQGWPLLKSVTAFHLDKLIPDATLVTVPCASPEQSPLSFGCTHQQTMLWEMFNAVEKAWNVSDDMDTAFLTG
jgi:alpha-L-fucosidase 2